VLERRGRFGWAKDNYLWPVCVAAGPRGELVVADAQVGRVSFLDDRLRARDWFGCNGPDDAMLDMPYGVTWAHDGTMIVADTYKSRLLFVDPERREIRKVYYLNADLLESAYTLPTSRLCPVANGDEAPRPLPAPSFRADSAFAPLGAHYGGYENHARTLRLRFPRLWPAGRDRWWEAYHGLVSISGRTPFLTFGGTTLLCGSLYYFIQGLDHELDGALYTLLWSPVADFVLVFREGVAVPIQLKPDLWTDGTHLIERGTLVHPRDVVRLAADGFARFDALLGAGVPHPEAYRRAAFDWMPAVTYHARFAATFHSDAGGRFWAAYQATPERAEQVRLAAGYLTAVAAENVVSLPELSLVHMLLHEPR
jgi:hypothetical protein